MGVPQQFGPYRVVRELARGGMGVVYEVTSAESGGRYALKTILPGVAGSAELIRFQREAEVLARIDHPNVVRVHAARFDTQPPYFVQEFLSGGTLADRLRLGSLSPQEATSVVGKLAHGLAAAHGLGILHRDLKPENVLFDEQGEPKLADFGLARRAEVEAQGLTLTGVILGTPAFMAPEQAMDPRSADERSDVYALGAVLYAALTGEPPFRAAGTIAMLRKVIEEPAVAPSAVRRGLSSELDALCLRALSKDPAARYAGAIEFAQALEGGETRAASRTPWVVLALSAVLLVVGLALFARSGGERQAPPEVKLSRLEAASRAAGAPGELPRLRADLAAITSALNGQEAERLKRVAARVRFLEALECLARGDRAAAVRLAPDALRGDDRRALRAAFEGTDPTAAHADAHQALSAVAEAFPSWAEWARLRDEAWARAVMDARWVKALNELNQRHQTRASRRSTELERATKAFPEERHRGHRMLQANRRTLQGDIDLFEGLSGPYQLNRRRPLARQLMAEATRTAHEAYDDARAPRVDVCDRLRYEFRVIRLLDPQAEFSDEQAEHFGRLFVTTRRDDGRGNALTDYALLASALAPGCAQLHVDLSLASQQGKAFSLRMRPILCRGVQLQTDPKVRRALEVSLIDNLIVSVPMFYESLAIYHYASELLKAPGLELQERGTLLRHRARVALRARLDAEALADSTEGYALLKGQPEFLHLRAKALYALGRDAEACESAWRYVSAWSDGNSDNDLVNCLAILWDHEPEQRERLLPYMTKLIPLGVWPGWLLRLALYQLQAGRRDEALAVLSSNVAEQFERRPTLMERSMGRTCRQALNHLEARQGDEAERVLKAAVAILDRFRGRGHDP